MKFSVMMLPCEVAGKGKLCYARINHETGFWL